MKPHPVTGQMFESPVPPGTGWPHDPATAETPVARTRTEVAGLAAGAKSVEELAALASVCRACPRLVEWREDVAIAKRRAFAEEPYWGRPVPSFGVSDPQMVIVGLAPSAHGGNRTGRQFTGDLSGDWLYAALHRAGFANQVTSVDSADGLELKKVRLMPAVHCAPPQNKPNPGERDICGIWLQRELELVSPTVRVVFALGSFAWSSALRAARAIGWQVPRPQPKFGHQAESVLHNAAGEPVVLLGCYHVSQRNTQTGALTVEMLDSAFARANEIINTPMANM